MNLPNVIEVNNTQNERLNNLEAFQSNIINLIYPVGSIYMSVNNVSPATFLGGTWVQIKDRFLLSSGDSYSAGSTGGEASHTLSVAETPAHTHTRGSMNITGHIGSTISNGAGWLVDTFYGGCLNPTNYNRHYPSAGAAGNATYPSTIEFNASKNWTGETSSVGGNTAHNNMPPYLTVYMWKRTA